MRFARLAVTISSLLALAVCSGRNGYEGPRQRRRVDGEAAQ